MLVYGFGVNTPPFFRRHCSAARFLALISAIFGTALEQSTGGFWGVIGDDQLTAFGGFAVGV